MGATEAKPEVTTKTSPQLLINWLTEEVQTGKKGTPILTKQLHHPIAAQPSHLAEGNILTEQWPSSRSVKQEVKA